VTSLRERVSILILSSDGKTPDEVAKQILQIHAILPGQKPERQFNIPIRSSTQQTNTESTHQQSTPQQSAPQQAASQQSAPQQAAPQEAVPAPVAAQQTVSQHVEQPTPFQPVPVSAAQNPQEGVGQRSNLEGAAFLEPSRSVAKNTFPNDPTNPSVIPRGKPKPQPDFISESTKAKLDDEMPPSKLLNSNPAAEPRRDDRLQRKDSETQEDDEFVDAQS
jgi:hypothetical protein